jgi:hypothetical protein
LAISKSKITNRLVAGLDYYKSNILNEVPSYVDGGISLINQTDSGKVI